MITVIEGDLFTSKAMFLAHQVNCKKVMDAGVAYQVKKRYPEVFAAYKQVCSEKMLGKIQCVPIWREDKNIGDDNVLPDRPARFVVNMFGQKDCGMLAKQYTSLEALQKCFHTMADILRSEKYKGETVAMPYLLGCVRGGANWSDVYQLMETEFDDCNVELWKLDVH